MKKNVLISFIISFTFVCHVQALTFVLPPHGQNVVGQVQYVPAEEGDTLVDLGIEYDIGRDAMQAANPQYSLEQELAAGTLVIIPSRFILPDYPRRGMIVNVSEMRLYYYPPNTNIVMTYPIGIGKEGHNTPITVTSIVDKKIDPSWTPPKSIRDFNKKQGIILPKVILGGPDNPLGRRALYLSLPEYRIHATNFPESVGSRGSFGCIRMKEQDIDEFFPYIGKKTQVRIVEEPYKVGWYNGQIYFEAHQPLIENKYKLSGWLAPVSKTLLQVATEQQQEIDWYKVRMALEWHSGMPTIISTVMPDNSPIYVMKPMPYWPSNTSLCRLSKHC